MDETGATLRKTSLKCSSVGSRGKQKTANVNTGRGPSGKHKGFWWHGVREGGNPQWMLLLTAG